MVHIINLANSPLSHHEKLYEDHNVETRPLTWNLEKAVVHYSDWSTLDQFMVIRSIGVIK